MKTSELIKLINPRIKPSYSPNLFKYVKRFGKEAGDYRFPEVFQAHKDSGFVGGLLYTGYMDAAEGKNGFVGARLNRVLGVGASIYGRERGWFIGLGPDNMTHITDFWERYIEIGRCAIDKEHKQFFIGDNERYTEVDGIRTCLWCGARHQKMIEIKIIDREITHYVEL